MEGVHVIYRLALRAAGRFQPTYKYSLCLLDVGSHLKANEGSICYGPVDMQLTDVSHACFEIDEAACKVVQEF